VDEAVVSQLMDMGFPRNACLKGVHFTNNTGIEAAMNWVMEHMDDAGWFAHNSFLFIQQAVSVHVSVSQISQILYSIHLTITNVLSDQNC